VSIPDLAWVCTVVLVLTLFFFSSDFALACKLAVKAMERDALPEEITTSQSLSTFRQQLKTWLFRQSYPGIII